MSDEKATRCARHGRVARVEGGPCWECSFTGYVAPEAAERYSAPMVLMPSGRYECGMVSEEDLSLLDSVPERIMQAMQAMQASREARVASLIAETMCYDASGGGENE